MNTETFRVVKILNTKQIIVNAGIKNGVTIGTKFKILDKFGSDPIIDPETKEELGRLDITKATLIVTAVYPKMSILESESTYHINGKASYFFNDYHKSIKDSLNVDLNEISGDISTKSDLPIQIGDKAKMIE